MAAVSSADASINRGYRGPGPLGGQVGLNLQGWIIEPLQQLARVGDREHAGGDVPIPHGRTAGIVNDLAGKGMDAILGHDQSSFAASEFRRTLLRVQVMSLRDPPAAVTRGGSFRNDNL